VDYDVKLCLCTRASNKLQCFVCMNNDNVRYFWCDGNCYLQVLPAELQLWSYGSWISWNLVHVHIGFTYVIGLAALQGKSYKAGWTGILDSLSCPPHYDRTAGCMWLVLLTKARCFGPSAKVPPCDTPALLNKITRHFGTVTHGKSRVSVVQECLGSEVSVHCAGVMMMTVETHN